MTPENHQPRPPCDPLVDLLEAMLTDPAAADVSAETARTVRALRHAAEYTVMAAEMLLHGDRSGHIVSPEQALAWASISLAAVWDGANVLCPKVYCS